MGVWRWCLATPATPRNGDPPTPLSPASPPFSPCPTSPCQISTVPQSTSLGTGCTLPPSPRDCEVATNGRRGEIGVGGVSTPSGPVLPGTMGEPILHPGSGEALRVLPPEGLGGAGPAKPGGPRRSPRAPQSRGWSKAGPGRKSRSRGEAPVSFHADYRLRERSLAMPHADAALLFDIAGRAGGRVRSPSITVAAPRGRSRPAHRRPAP